MADSTKILTIGEKIKKLREIRGLSQSKLAKLAEVNQNYISRLESGDRKDISFTIARKLAYALDISLIELAKGLDDPGISMESSYVLQNPVVTSGDIDQMERQTKIIREFLDIIERMGSYEFLKQMKLADFLELAEKTSQKNINSLSND